MKLRLVNSKKKSAKKAYPQIENHGALVDEFIRLQAVEKATVGALKTIKSQLRDVAAPEFFRVNSGSANPESTLKLKGTELNEARVSFTNRYSKIEPEVMDELAESAGVKKMESFFNEVATVKIEGGVADSEVLAKIIAAVKSMGSSLTITLSTEEQKKAEPLVELFCKTVKVDGEDCLAPLLGVEPELAYTVKDGFHTARHTAMTADQNKAFDLAVPCTAQCAVSNSNPEIVAAETVPAPAKKAGSRKKLVAA